MSTLIVICPITGARLCRDNQWREFANFGTGKTCVKTYRYPGAALKAGRRYRIKPAKPGETISHVIHLNDGDQMFADGRIVRRNGRIE
jgi:hypothetical protein